MLASKSYHRASRLISAQTMRSLLVIKQRFSLPDQVGDL